METVIIAPEAPPARRKSGPKPKAWPPNYCDHCGIVIIGGWKPHRRKYCTLDCAIAHDRQSRKIVNQPDFFWSRVDKDSPPPSHVAHLEPCWEWQGSRTPQGYGSTGGLRAHRVAWMIVHGEIPDGQWILHKCDNPICVRVEDDPETSHLYLGTVQQNVQDMIDRGRAYFQTHPRPPKVKMPKQPSREGLLKLKEDGVLLLLALYEQTDLSLYWMGRMLGVHESTVRGALRALGYEKGERGRPVRKV